MSYDHIKLKLSYCNVVWFLDISADCNAYGQCTDCKSNISVCSLCVNIVVQIA